MRGSVFKRCQCRDAAGKKVKSCRKAHGSWACTVDAGIDPKTGKRKQKVRSGYRIKDAAEDALTKELAAIVSGTWTDDRNVKLGAWLDQWLADLAADGRAVNTITNYTTHVPGRLEAAAWERATA